MSEVETRNIGGIGFGSPAWTLFLVLILLFFGIDGICCGGFW